MDGIDWRVADEGRGTDEDEEIEGGEWGDVVTIWKAGSTQADKCLGGSSSWSLGLMVVVFFEKRFPDVIPSGIYI